MLTHCESRLAQQWSNIAKCANSLDESDNKMNQCYQTLNSYQIISSQHDAHQGMLLLFREKAGQRTQSVAMWNHPPVPPPPLSWSWSLSFVCHCSMLTGLSQCTHEDTAHPALSKDRQGSAAVPLSLTARIHTHHIPDCLIPEEGATPLQQES